MAQYRGLGDPYVAAVKGFEGFTPVAKWDYKQHSGGYGSRAAPGQIFTKEQADAQLRADLENARMAVRSFNPNLDPGTEAALTSLTQNAGTTWMNSGLGAAVKRGDWQDVRDRFVQYNRAGGKVLPGLVSRRATERTWMGASLPQYDRVGMQVLASEAGDGSRPAGMMRLGGPQAGQPGTQSGPSGPIYTGPSPSIAGLQQPGNIDLNKRPVVRNQDGSISTVRSTSFNIDGREVLLPTVTDDGRVLDERSPEGRREIFDLYRRTGKHLGMFDTPENATAYAQSLHKDQEHQYVPKSEQSDDSGFFNWLENTAQEFIGKAAEVPKSIAAPVKAYADMPVADRASMLPIGVSERGTLMPVLPSMVTEPFAAFQRGIEAYNQGGKPAATDALTLAMTPMAGNLGARAVGAMPDNALGIFAGKMAKTADRKALIEAQRMAADGVARDDIWKSTGWFQGADGQWRFEIDDSASKFRNIGPDESTLGREMAHPEFYAAYPEMAGVGVSRVPGRGGQYSRDDIFGRQIEVGKDSLSRRSVALHESQHAGQDIENFAQGGSPAMFAYRNPQAADEAYHRLAGEVEARNIQKRRDYTAEQRRNTPPWLTQDVPDEQQIVRFAGGGQQLSVETPKGIKAYHGSPHDFDKFDSSKIGTGEGAQAYGHGIYFAEAEDVARQYRDNLSDITVNGELLNDTNWQHHAAWALNEAKGDRGEALRLLDDVFTDTPQDKKALSEAQAFLRSNADLSKVPKLGSSGKMYEVSIKADPEQFLDWDKPLGEQPKAAQTAFNRLLDRPSVDLPLREVLERAARQAGNDVDLGRPGATYPVRAADDAAVSTALREAGIPGIRYRDAGSRGQPIADPKYPNEVQFKRQAGNLTVKSRAGEIFATVNDHRKAIKISSSEVSPGSVGKGHGIGLYESLANKATKDGYVLQSDNSVTGEAARMYDALERRGYQVTRNPTSQIDPDDGHVIATDGKPAFTVSAPQGTYNYVVFPGNENLIDIVKKYGIAGAATITGMSQSDLKKVVDDDFDTWLQTEASKFKQ